MQRPASKSSASTRRTTTGSETIPPILVALIGHRRRRPARRQNRHTPCPPHKGYLRDQLHAGVQSQSLPTSTPDKAPATAAIRPLVVRHRGSVSPHLFGPNPSRQQAKAVTQSIRQPVSSEAPRRSRVAVILHHRELCHAGRPGGASEVRQKTNRWGLGCYRQPVPRHRQALGTKPPIFPCPPWLAPIDGSTETWPSGRRRSPAKGVGGKPSRGFESLRLRHKPFANPRPGPSAGLFSFWFKGV